MSVLHTALKSLAPITFADVPTDESTLQSWLSDIFTQSQVILDSIPIADPSDSSVTPRSSSSTVASNASEISLSSARPPPPIDEHQALQKEWGKPYKLGAKENALGMSVYKLSGKDGRGAWFARRSVHEGISFARFKKALEMEFPESLAVQGAPGEGNVRGIGGETRVEDIKVASKGRIEVYRLSAQFPGPTTPRDFVTLLITSNNAMAAEKEGEPALRHYTIISKPCNHPDTQPQSGFIRGFYESVEFIREIPRQIQTSQGLTELPDAATSKNADQKAKSSSRHEKLHGSEDTAISLQRTTTEPSGIATSKDSGEMNPVEWIMVTRSDPGGSVPRFMVERGTPGSICADAEKFLDWACQQDFDNNDIESAKEKSKPIRPTAKRDSHQSFRSSRMAGVQNVHNGVNVSEKSNDHKEVSTQAEDGPLEHAGVFGAVAGAAQYLSSYTPQIVLNHLPGSQTASPEQSKASLDPPVRDDDVASEASFESADSHLTSSESESASVPASASSLPTEGTRKSDENLSHHERELRKLEQRRAALQHKFSESRSKLAQAGEAQTAKEEQVRQKAIEKHDREVKKQQEKYEKELKRIEERQEKEKRKVEARKKKQADKDEKVKLTRERDEARQELELVKKEASTLRNVVQDLQKENTKLVARLGKVGVIDDLSGDGSSTPSRQSSIKAVTSHSRTDSASHSIKSQ